MRDDAVEGAAPVEREHRHGRPAAEGDVASVGHFGRVAGEHRVDGDGDVRRQRGGRRQDAPQVVLLLDRPDEVDRRAGLVLSGLGQGDEGGAAGAVVDGRAGEAPASQLEHPRQVHHGRADPDTGCLGLLS